MRFLYNSYRIVINIVFFSLVLKYLVLRLFFFSVLLDLYYFIFHVFRMRLDLFKCLLVALLFEAFRICLLDNLALKSLSKLFVDKHSFFLFRLRATFVCGPPGKMRKLDQTAFT